MAEVQQNDGGGKKKGHQKKMTIRVDFTPMVDMNMLLITFFMLCTTMIKSQTLSIALPSNEKVDNVENMSQASAEDAITIIIDAKKKPGPNGTLLIDSVNHNVVNEIYYYEGKPGGNEGMFGAGNSVLSQNNNLKKSELLSDEVNSVGDHKARGIRQIIQERNKVVYEKIKALKKDYNDGKFGSLETKEGREKAAEKYQEAAKKIRNMEETDAFHHPRIIIKSTSEASYRGLVDILDEMQINNIKYYQVDNISDVDLVMLDDYRKNHK